MADRPILFSAPMVQALLAGTKTQTRRILKPQPNALNGGLPLNNGRGSYSTEAGWRPYRFHQGGRLWVREAFARVGFREPEKVYYRADGEHQHMGTGTESNGNVTVYYTDFWELNGKRRKGSAWKPGIHMPRWASRLTLAVTDVRVQRLQEIGGEDAVAEGIDPKPHLCGCERCSQTSQLCPATSSSLALAYGELWDSINGAGAWDANPWIIALTFTVERRNIDAARI